MKILLACLVGMSTSLIEKSISDYFKSIGENVEVVAKPSNEAREIITNYDICLLGPQVKYIEGQFKQVAGNIPVVVIPPHIYAMAKGDERYKLAKDNLKS